MLKHNKQPNHDQKKLKALFNKLDVHKPKKIIEKTRDVTSQLSLHHQTSQIAMEKIVIRGINNNKK